MSHTGHEPDKLWRLIEEQKRLADVPFRSQKACDLYSHDTRQTWVQAVFASLRGENRRRTNRKAARRRLERAILLSGPVRFAPRIAGRLSLRGKGRSIRIAAALIVMLLAFALLAAVSALHK